jgi:pseudouridine-5'-phosphate glycosidase
LYRYSLGGVVFGVPIPAKDEAVGAGVEAAIGTALREAEQQNVAGNAVTPFLLQRIRELTGGASLTVGLSEGHTGAIAPSIDTRCLDTRCTNRTANHIQLDP